MTWRQILIIASIVMFLLAALDLFGVISGIKPLAWEALGLATFAGAHL